MSYSDSDLSDIASDHNGESSAPASDNIAFDEEVDEEDHNIGSDGLQVNFDDDDDDEEVEQYPAEDDEGDVEEDDELDEDEEEEEDDEEVDEYTGYDYDEDNQNSGMLEEDDDEVLPLHNEEFVPDEEDDETVRVMPKIVINKVKLTKKIHDSDESYNSSSNSTPKPKSKPSKVTKTANFGKKKAAISSSGASRSKRPRGSNVSYKEPDLNENISYDKDEIFDEDSEINPNEDDEFDEYYGSATPDLTKMTERQRRKYLEEQHNSGDESRSVSEAPIFDNSASEQPTTFLSLPNGKPKKKKKILSAEEAQMRKLEMARKRKNINEKKLEEEKRETLNKLLKKRAKKTRDLKSLNTEQDEEAKTSIKPRRPILEHPAFFRWISNKEGVKLGVPSKVAPID